jgi:DNA topoisomerase-1
MKYMIVESPSKCNIIEKYLKEITGDNNWKCLATLGHFRLLKNLNREFEPTYCMDEKKQKHIEKIQKILKNVSLENIFLATDDDREGESIAWHFISIMEWSIEKVNRIVFHEITKDAIDIALQHPRKIDIQWVISQQTRQALDRLVGFKVSRLLWKYVSNDKLSAGRCQTPALQLIYENKTQIIENKKNEKIDKKFTTRALFFSQNNGGFWFTLNKNHKEDADVIQFFNNYHEKQGQHKYKLIIGESNEKLFLPPIPFKTATLLQKVFCQLHWSTKKTMNLCQELYQKGFITYMRTESTQYAESFIKEAQLYISQRYCCSSSLSSCLSSIQKGGHEAIRVTTCNIEFLPNTIGTNQKDQKELQLLYHIIWKNTIQSCMNVGMDDVTKIIIENTTNNDTFFWEYFVHKIKAPGWRLVEKEQQEKKTKKLSVETNEMFFFSTINIIQPPTCMESIVVYDNPQFIQHYSEASLVAKLVQLEIGRPSTYSNIIESLLIKKYVETDDIPGNKIECNDYFWCKETGFEIRKKTKIINEEKQKMIITPLGEKTVEFLMKGFVDLFSYEYTKNMEKALDIIRESTTTMNEKELCLNCVEQIKKGSKKLSELYSPISISSEWEICWKSNTDDIYLRNKNTNEYCPIIPGLKHEEINIENIEKIKMKTEWGVLEGEKVFLKKGPFGLYTEWKNETKSLQQIKYQDITSELLFEIFCGGKNIEKTGDEPRERPSLDLARQLNTNLSIRRNKKTQQPYIYYKTETMIKPLFFPLKDIWRKNFMACNKDELIQWIQNTYLQQLIL